MRGSQHGVPIELARAPRWQAPDNDIAFIEDVERVLSIWKFLLHKNDAR